MTSLASLSFAASASLVALAVAAVAVATVLVVRKNPKVAAAVVKATDQSVSVATAVQADAKKV